MRTSETTAAIAEALVRANETGAGLINPAKSKDAGGGQKRYKYAPLPAVLDEVRAVLYLHGLALVQETATYEGNVGVTTRLFHTSGEWVEFGPLIMPPAHDAQAVGSAITYACRYALCAALGIAGDDDDDGVKAKASGGESGAFGEGVKDSPSDEPLKVAYGTAAKALRAARIEFGDGIRSVSDLDSEQVKVLVELARP